MEVEILIDELTDCLVESATGKIVSTQYNLRTMPVTRKEYKGWKFDWSKPEKDGYSIYELFVEGDNVVQGRIAVKIDGGVAQVDVVETAPHNFGKNGQYSGVGGHLFAIACQLSLDAGCDGVVAFTAKSELVDYYKEMLHAVEIATRRMVIFEDAAELLLDKYMRK